MEEIKEVSKEECCKKGGHFMKHGHCCGHKAMRAALLGVAIFAIFAFGIGVGRHLGEGRGFERGNFEQRGGGMMRGYNNIQGNVQGQNGGCGFQNQNNQRQFQRQIEVQVPTQVQAAPIQVKPVTPAK